MNHDEITRQLGGVERYGKGITPNPFAPKEMEWARRKQYAPLREALTAKMESIFEPRFITTPPTCELLESLITMIDAREVLELGMCTGFGSMHMLRALVGKPGAKLTSVDARPAHDREFFESPPVAPWFDFLLGWTPEILHKLHGRVFQLVFIDSDHSLAHSEKELAEVMKITAPGSVLAWHDVPKWRTPSIREEPPIRPWLRSLIASGRFDGLMLPSPRQLDCIEEYGDPNYPVECSPGLAVLIRK